MPKKLSAGLAAFVLLVVLGGYALPTEFNVEAQRAIQAPPKLIFAFIADLDRWRDWQPWYDMDPRMTVKVSRPSWAINAASVWESEKRGKGEVIFAEWQLNQFVAYRLKIDDGNPSIGRIEILPAEGTYATVKWSLRGETGRNPFARYVGQLRKFLIAKDFKAGLAKLALKCESLAGDDVKAPWGESK